MRQGFGDITVYIFFSSQKFLRQIIIKKPLPPGTGDRGKSFPTAMFRGGIPSVFFDRRNLINLSVMPISRGAYNCQDCTLALHKMQR